MAADHPFRPDIHLLNQHFLDPAVSRALVDQVDIGCDDVVLDLGAGTGSFTAPILRRRPRSTIAIETDLRCAPALHALAARATGLRTSFTRIQDLDPAELSEVTMIVSNPPFSTLEHIAALIRLLPSLTSAHLCVSLSWARSVVAAPEDRSYSLSSLLVQTRFHAQLRRLIEGSCFTPPTRRPAAWLRLDRKPTTDPLLDLVADTTFRRGGTRLKDLLRSRAVQRLPLDATRVQALQADPRITKIQQRRLSALSRRELAQLVLAIEAHRGEVTSS